MAAYGRILYMYALCKPVGASFRPFSPPPLSSRGWVAQCGLSDSLPAAFVDADGGLQVNKMGFLANLRLGFVLLFVAVATAQYFPPKPKGLTVVKSKHYAGASISYKKVNSFVSSCLLLVFHCG